MGITQLFSMADKSGETVLELWCDGTVIVRGHRTTDPQVVWDSLQKYATDWVAAGGECYTNLTE